MKFKPNKRGFISLRNSPEAMAAITGIAESIAAEAGEGVFVMPPERGKNRARVAVVTGTIQARVHEARDRTLTRAMFNAKG